MGLDQEFENSQRDFVARFLEALESPPGSYRSNLDELARATATGDDEVWLYAEPLLSFFDTCEVVTCGWGDGPPGGVSSLELLNGRGSWGYLVDSGDASNGIAVTEFARVEDRSDLGKLSAAIADLLETGAWPEFNRLPTSVSYDEVFRQAVKEGLTRRFNRWNEWADLTVLVARGTELTARVNSLSTNEVPQVADQEALIEAYLGLR